MVVNLHTRIALWVLFICIALRLNGQSTNYLTIGIGQQALWFEKEAFQSSDLSIVQNGDLSFKLVSLILGYEKLKSNHLFLRGFAGIVPSGQTYHFERTSEYGIIQNDFAVKVTQGFLRFGLGYALRGERIQFAAGPQLYLGYLFSRTSTQDYRYFDLSDSTTTRTISTTESPGAVSIGNEIFLALRYSLTKRLIIGLEPRVYMGFTFVNGEIKTTRTITDGNGNTIAETEESSEFKRANFQSSFYLSPPILTLSYRL